MNERILKYGCNPNQSPARIYLEDGADLPITVHCGNPGYINFLDALNGWQLVKELKEACGLPCATSFKHVSPTSASLSLPMSDAQKAAAFVDDIDGLDESPLALAYARARGTDRMSSFGDFIALSDVCDEMTARVIAREVSDGVIAPGYSKEALSILCNKRNGTYNVIEMDPAYEPEEIEHKQVFGITFEQRRNDQKISADLLTNIVSKKKELPESAVRDMLVALITLKYTQSNSVCFATDGQAIGVGAGQQSRIHCTRLAAQKADLWHLRQSERVLSLSFRDGVSRPEKNNAIDLYLTQSEAFCKDGAGDYFDPVPAPFTKEEQRAYLSENAKEVVLASDAFFPFSDNIECGAGSGAAYVVEPGGSARDDEVIRACDACGMVLCMTGVRLFHH